MWVIFFLCLFVGQVDAEEKSALSKDSIGDIRPIPDPTALTTAQLFRELASLRAILETRIDAVDKDVVLIRKSMDKILVDVETRVAQLQALHAEKFRSIESQINEGKSALVVALQQSEKSNTEKNALQVLAISKAETNVSEQLKGVVALNTALKERVDRMEGQATGISGSWMALVGVFGIVAVCLSIFGAIRASASHLEVRSKGNT